MSCTSVQPNPAFLPHHTLLQTKMTGFFQTAFYFGYTLMFCVGEFSEGHVPGPQAATCALPP